MRLDINANDLVTVLKAALRGQEPEEAESIRRVITKALVGLDIAMQREDEIKGVPV